MIGQPGTRTRAIAYAVGGVALTLLCTVLVKVMAEKAAGANYNPKGPVKLLMAVPALGMAAGLCLIYVGLARIVAGKLVDKIDLKKINGAGLLYVLGFAGMIALAMYVLIGVFQVNPITMERF